MVELVLSQLLPEYGKMEAMLKCEARSEGGEIVPSVFAASWASHQPVPSSAPHTGD